ncbi:MAG: glycosyltransferase family 39 protein [Candidatus Omnitrophota bacterium]|nr:glycosyltransferase family 39 protein [Candidatus Omnitrophota bacterium]
MSEHILTRAIKSKRYYVILVSLILFHLINNYIWLRIDNVPLIFDAHKNFMVSLKIFKAFSNFPHSFLSNIIKATESGLYAPFVPFIVSTFYKIIGINYDKGVMINNIIFLPILVFSAFGIGKKMFNKQVGLLAAFLLTMYPIIFNQLKLYMLELPAVAMVSLSIYILLRTNNFRNLRYSILFGMVLSLSILTHYKTLFFIIVPLLVVVFYILLDVLTFFKPIRWHKAVSPQTSNKKSLMLRGFNLGISLIIFMGLLLPYLSSIMSKASFERKTYLYVTPSDLPINNLGFWSRGMVSTLWYFKTLIEVQISFFFLVIFIIGLYFSLKYFKNKRPILFLLFWLIAPFILITYIFRPVIGYYFNWSSPRYTMPILVPIALISSAGIMKIYNKKIKFTVIITIILIGIIQFFAVSFGINLLPSKIKVELPIFKRSNLLPHDILLFNQEIPIPSAYYSHPTIEKPYYKEILDIINNTRPKDKRIKITVIPDIAPLWGYLQYRTYIENLPFDILCDAVNIYYWYPVDFRELILDPDYIITKEGGWLSDFYLIGEIDKAMRYFYLHKEKFALIKEIKLAEDETVLIYKRKEK